MQEIFSVVGVSVVGAAMVAAIMLAGRWLWLKIPHHASHEGDILQRLSEIVVALNAQNEVLRKPNTEVGISNGYLLEIRHALKDQLEMCQRSTPTLDLLQKINEHLFADVASRAQIDELINVCKESRDAACSASADIESIGPLIKKQDAAKMLALDAMVMGFDKFAKDQKQFMKAIFDGGSISTVDDEKSARLEKIDKFMRIYGLDRAAATQRVDGTAVYEPSQGRGTMRGES